MSTRPSIKKALVLAIASLGAVAGTIQPAKATLDPPLGALQCDANSPVRPANGEITGLGTAEHKALQDGIYTPAHEARCPQTVGKIGFDHTTDAFAIDSLQRRWIPNTNPAMPTPYIGLNQPLSTKEWLDAVNSTNNPGLFIGAGTFIFHLPLMIDGFVVTANIPCSGPPSSGLKLTPLTLSLVYTGAVTTWGDAALLADNPWLQGCTTPIVVSARTDAAWSNAIVKDYMSKQNPVFEHYEQRDNLASWPATLSIGCAANSEAGMVSCAANPGAISYMRYATAKANNLSPVRMTNGKGQTPAPAVNPAHGWPSACPAAVRQFSLALQDPYFSPNTLLPLGAYLDWSTFSLTFGDGYPLCGFGYVVGPVAMPTGTSQMESDARRDRLKLMWSDTSQEALKDYGYAPIPSWLRTGIRFTEPVFG